MYFVETAIDRQSQYFAANLKNFYYDDPDVLNSGFDYFKKYIKEYPIQNVQALTGDMTYEDLTPIVFNQSDKNSSRNL